MTSPGGTFKGVVCVSFSAVQSKISARVQDGYKWSVGAQALHVQQAAMCPRVVWGVGRSDRRQSARKFEMSTASPWNMKKLEPLPGR
jgi:hypothetical protein